MTAGEEQIRVFCPKHEFSFVTAPTAEIQCRMDAHALALDFPQGEWWGFCCDCQTFFPSSLHDGKNAETNCPSCERQIVRRFACSQCKVASVESDGNERKKLYHVDSQTGIEPACPACKTVNADAEKHDCAKIGAMILTARQICPFCEKNLRSTAAIQSPKEVVDCPQCGASNPPTANFCGKCNYQLKEDVERLGDDVNKTQLLGSLCPKCSTPIPPDSGFCGECGQAVKKVIPPPPPPPPPQATAANFPQNSEQPVPAVSSVSNNNLRNVFIGVGAVVGFFVLVGIISSVSKSSSVSSSNSNVLVKSNTNSVSKSTNSRSDNSSANYKPAVSNTPNDSTADSRIGKTGTINMDCNLRESASKDSSWVGTHYRGASIKILDVATVPSSYGGTTDWFKIEVVSYGNSMDPAKYGQYGKDDGSEDVGWVNSYPEVYEGNRKVRRQLVNLK